MVGEEEWSTVQVANLPLEASRWELEQIFSEVGPIKKCFVLKPREGKSTTLGYVTFAMVGDSRTALAKQDELVMGENKLRLKIAPDRKVFGEKPAAAASGGGSNSINKSKARLVIRNLSFKADDSSLRNFLAPHGQLKDVNILKKPDGRMVGCAFVEFTKVVEATKAVKSLNASQFLGRTIAVDWAVPKEVFSQKNTDPESEVKEEVKEEDIKEEDVKDEEDVKEEPDSDNEENQRIEEWKDDAVEVEENDGSSDEDEEEDEDEDEDEDEKEDFSKEDEKKPHNLHTGHDINEGKTVFVRNLSYDTEEEDLKAMMDDNFGKVIFAKLVMDKVMGHPRGTAFVKFRRSEDAGKCVEVGDGEEGIFLDGRRLGILLAQQKEEVEKRQKEREGEKKEAKDSRNLYLAREGLIREGTQAAEGVSPSDLARRKVVERQKKNLLKNLNMFVSANRLCVRNLPAHVDDSRLKSIFAKEVKKGARITEAKVMRNLAGESGGEAVSKEFGFVSFENHEDALQALRNVNNNPGIFTPERRPIVEFSIENRKALLARQKRLEKSREKNPNSKEKNLEKKKLDTKNRSVVNEVESKEFTGMTSDPKQKGLPTHSGAKVRTDRKKDPKISRKALRKQEMERKNPKLRKRKLEHVKENITDAPDPKKSKKEKRKLKKVSKEAQKEMESEKKFSSLVSQYKKDISTNVEVRKKWFDT